MTAAATDPTISLLAEDALLFDFSNHPDPQLQIRLWQLARALQQRPETSHELQDLVPGPGNLMLRLRPEARIDLTRLTDMVETLWDGLNPAEFNSRCIEIPVNYGGEAGPDLAEVARYAGLSEQQVIQRHSAATYQVLCLGFQPGFPYLGGLDPALFIPRKATPATRIPAGSVAIGGQQTGIYPVSSPGGWHIIGRTSVTLFDITRSPPCLLQAGDQLRFVQEAT